MHTEKELEAIYRNFCNGAVLNFQNRGTVAPFVFVISSDQIRVIAMTNKEATVALLPDFLREHKAEAVIVVSEVWVKSYEKDEAPKALKGPVRDIPGRKEGIMVSLESRFGVLSKMWIIERGQGGQAQLTEQEEVREATETWESRFTRDYFKPRPARA